MNPDSSPFTPGKPVEAEFFTGRKKQVEELLAMVRTAKNKDFKSAGFRVSEGWEKFACLAYRPSCRTQ